MADAQIPQSATQNIDIQIDLSVLSTRLIQDPQFIALVSKAVRDQMLKDVRNKKTLFGKWGGTTPK